RRRSVALSLPIRRDSPPASNTALIFIKNDRLRLPHGNITLKAVKEDGISSGQIIRRKQDGSLEYVRDELTIEEPLEIRIGRKTVATTMRTPGHDDELAAGFLLSEAIIRERRQIEKISTDRDNIATVHLRPHVKVKLKTAQRFGTISSSCGLCGKT